MDATQMSLGADCAFAPDISLTPFEAVEAARQLHELLIAGATMVSEQKRTLARQISGRLFAAEAHRILPDPCRAFFLRLRNDAHDRAHNPDSKTLSTVSRVSAGYDQIEEAVRYSA